MLGLKLDYISKSPAHGLSNEWKINTMLEQLIKLLNCDPCDIYQIKHSKLDSRKVLHLNCPLPFGFIITNCRTLEVSLGLWGPRFEEGIQQMKLFSHNWNLPCCHGDMCSCLHTKIIMITITMVIVIISSMFYIYPSIRIYVDWCNIW